MRDPTPTLAILGLIYAAIVGPPGPREARAAPPALDSMLAYVVGPRGPDSTVWLATKVYARNLVAGDTTVFTYFRNDTLLVTRRWTRSWDSLQTRAPGYGLTATYKGCAQLERGGRTGSKYPGAPLCWTWPYSRPALPVPPPVLDSLVRIVLRMKPLVLGGPYVRSGTANDLNRAQACAFGGMASGRRVKLANSWNNRTCELLYQAWVRSETTSPLLGGAEL